MRLSEQAIGTGKSPKDDKTEDILFRLFTEAIYITAPSQTARQRSPRDNHKHTAEPPPKISQMTLRVFGYVQADLSRMIPPKKNVC